MGNLWEPTAGTEDPKADMLRECVRRQLILNACAEDLELRAWVIERCRHDFWFFLGTFIWVEHPESGPMAALTWRPMWQDAIDCFLGTGRWLGQPLRMQLIKKSRMTGGTIMLAAAMFWRWLFHDSQSYVIGSRQSKDVDDKRISCTTSVLAKFRYFMKHLPAWLTPAPWLVNDRPRNYDSAMQLAHPDRSGIISGVSTTGDSARSMRAVRLVLDEANHIPWLPDMMEAGSMVGAMTLLSSVKGRAAGKGAHFIRLASGQEMPISQCPEEPGLVVHTIRYDHRPDLNPDTEVGAARIYALRQRMSDAVWQQEMEIKYDLPQANLIWGEVLHDSAKLAQPDWDRMLDIVQQSEGGAAAVWIDAWDFGETTSPTVWVRLCYIRAIDVMVVVDHRSWVKVRSKEIARDLAPIFAVRRADYVVGDISCTQVRSGYYAGHFHGPSRSWQDTLEEQGITITPQSIYVDKAINHVLAYVMDGRLQFAPPAQYRRPESSDWPCPHECVANYRYNLDVLPQDHKGKDPPPAKDMYSHIADAIQHGFRCLYNINRRENRRGR